MTDEPRTSSPNGTRSDAGRPPRRAYARPQLVEFGSVQELTRGASGPAKDAAKTRKGK